ncbi:MAG: hypothetical protein GY926_14160 [bacterium]|nr:hypothetical protein [bacterium]MCP4966363.1 hypothetical protein [bacterium]
MTTPPRREKTSWVDDALGGLTSIALEALVVLCLAAVALAVAWIAVTVM